MPFFNNLMKNAKCLVECIEGKKLPFSYWIAYLYGIFIARGILEGFLESTHHFPKTIHLFIHWPFWNFNFLISIALILFFITREKIEKTTKLVFAFSFLILLVPIIDFCITGGKGFSLSYAMRAEEIYGVLYSFGGIIGESIITPGQSITIWTAIFFIFGYILLKNRSIIMALVGVFSFYLMGVFYASFPLALASVFKLKQSFNHEVAILTILFLLSLAVIQSTLWLYLYNKRTAKALLKNLKMLRAEHYLGLTILGALFVSPAFPNILLDFKTLLASMVSVFFAFEFCLVYNNIYDEQIPKSIDKKQYERIGFAMLFFSLFFAALTNFFVIAFLFLAIMIGLYYSVPPIRLKRLGFLNNTVIGFLSMLVAGIGFLSQNPNPTTIQLNASLAVFITFSLAANIKDLKDYKTDKREGIKTLPVLLGEEKGLKAIALLSSISFVIPPILLGYPNLTIIGTLFGLANYYLLNKTKKETTTFALYFTYAVFFALRLMT